MVPCSRRLFITNNSVAISGFSVYQVLLTAVELYMGIFVYMYETTYKTLATLAIDQHLVDQGSNGKQAK